MGKYSDTSLVLIPDPDLFTTFPTRQSGIQQSKNQPKKVWLSKEKGPWAPAFLLRLDATAAPQPELLLQHLGFPSLSQCDPNLAKRKRTCLLWGKAERFWRLHHLQELGALCRRENWLFRGKQELSLKEEQASDWRGAGNFPGVKRSSHVTKEKALQNSSQGSYLWGCGGQAA